jgi:hypothetical protein
MVGCVVRQPSQIAPGVPRLLAQSWLQVPFDRVGVGSQGVIEAEHVLVEEVCVPLWVQVGRGGGDDRNVRTDCFDRWVRGLQERDVVVHRCAGEELGKVGLVPHLEGIDAISPTLNQPGCGPGIVVGIAGNT